MCIVNERVGLPYMGIMRNDQLVKCIINDRVGLPYMGIVRNDQLVKCVLLMKE